MEQDKYFTKARKVAKLTAAFFAILSYIGQISLLWVLGYGCYIILTEKDFDAGNLASFAFYAVYAGIGFAMLAGGFSSLKKISGIYNRIYTIINSLEDREEVMIHNKLCPEKNSFGPSIKFYNIDFTYPARDMKIFDNFNLLVNPGEVLVISGANGSGKSTMFHLLTGLYRPNSG